MADPFGGLLSHPDFPTTDQVRSLARTVELAELALGGYGAFGLAVSDGTKQAVLALAASTVASSCALDEPDSEGGVLLWEGVLDTPGHDDLYRVRLMTKVDMYPYVLAVLDGTEFVAQAMFEDGRGPQPGIHLDWPRYRAVVGGLLRLLEEWAKELVESEDYNWGDGVNEDVLHPKESLERARELRERAARLELVGEVMTS